MKTKCNFFTVSVLLLFILPLFSQSEHIHTRQCGSDNYTKELLKDNNYKKDYLRLQREVEQALILKSNVPCTSPIIIPVAIHYNTPITDVNTACLIDAAQKQVNQLNLDFSSCNENSGDWCNFLDQCPSYFSDPNGGDVMPLDGSCIQFCLADQNLPTGEDNIGGYAITVGDYAWPSVPGSTWDDFLNVFVSNEATAGQGSGTLGIAPLNGGSNPNGNGVWVLLSAFGAADFVGCASGGSIGNNTTFSNGATLTHEIGHYLGLGHTFSDNLADTPPQSSPNYGCPSLDTNNCTTSAGNDHSFNFMDYVNDDCMSVFSSDQVTVMQTITAQQSAWATASMSCYADWTNGTNVYSSCEQECGPGSPPIASFTPGDGESVTMCGPNGIQFTDTSTQLPTSWSWSFNVTTGDIVIDNTTSNSENPMLNITSGQNGTISTSLTVTNSNGSSTVSQLLNISVNSCMCNNTDISIPDNDVNGVSSVIYQPSSGILSDVEIEIDLSHTYVGDLYLALQHGNTTVVLIDRPGYPASTYGCNGNNIVDCIFDDESSNGNVENICNVNPAISGTFNAMDQLSVFNGVDIQGDWTLEVVDNANGDTGVLEEWCITFTTEVNNTECLSQANLSGNISDIADYESSDFIESSQILLNGAQIDYDATQSITLAPGFECKIGATVEAFIDGCNNGQGGQN